MIGEYFQNLWKAWQAFWFTPRANDTLAVMRIATGLMIAYVHAIWLYDLSAFLGPNSLVDAETLTKFHAGQWKWSYLSGVESMGLLTLHQCVAILAGLAMAAGLLTRISGPLAWFLTLMVCHRVTPFIFGLDQIVVFLSMYMMVAPAGSVWSVDAWIRDRRLSRSELPSWIGFLFPTEAASTMTNVATRLIQCHLCVIYLFGGLGKLRGEMWWEGTAIWFAAASYEYQSMDLTWIGRFPTLVSGITHFTVLWETFYIALIWPRQTRPIMLLTAVMVHMGIGLFMGMITFGVIMLVANFAFVSPDVTRRIFRAGQRSTSLEA
jgi:hypothetical protein